MKKILNLKANKMLLFRNKYNILSNKIKSWLMIKLNYKNCSKIQNIDWINS